MNLEKFYKNKKVLILGGAGFIGSNLALTLHKFQSNIIIIDNFHTACGGNIYNIALIEKNITLLDVDLSIENVIDLTLILEDVNVVFSLVGQIGHPYSMQFPKEDLKCNVLTHLNLLNSCQNCKNKPIIIYTSTRQIYGSPIQTPVTEEHPIQPPDVNGINKFSAELYYKLYEEIYGIESIILRLTNIYGPRQPIKTTNNGVFAWFLRQLLLGNDIPILGDGQQVREFLFVDDTVDALLKLPLKKTKERVFNLSHNEQATIRQLAEVMIEEFGQGKIVYKNFTASENKIKVDSFITDISKIQQAIDWSPDITLREGIKQTINYYKKFKQFYI